MNEITKLDTVQQYCDLFGIEALHPLISIVDCDKMSPIRHGRRLYNLYAVLLKDTDCGTMSYGRSLYDYEKRTVLFAAPGQVMGADDDGKLHQPAGWALVFHPELFEKRLITQNAKVANKMRDTTSSIGVKHPVRRDLPIGTFKPQIIWVESIAICPLNSFLFTI